MARLSEDAHDRLLVLLALLAPLLMFMLSKWRASLETWYVPMETAAPAHFSERFAGTVAQWLAEQGQTGPQLILLVDADCPCTQATLARLQEAIQQAAPSQKARLIVRYVGKSRGTRDERWQQVMSEIPATPTLLAVDGGRLLYAGPVNSGNFCSTAVNQVLGLSALTSRPSAPLLNWLARGCYCPLHKQPA